MAEPEQTPTLRLIEGLLALAVVNALLLAVAPQTFITVLFTPPLGLVLMLVHLAVIIAANAGILWWMRRRRSIAAALVTSLSGIALTAGLFANGDAWWQSFTVIPLIGGVASAMVAGLFLNRWWLRAAGALALVGAATALLLPPAIAQARQHEHEVAAAQAAEAAALEARVASSTLPFITELPGSVVWDVQPSDYVSHVRATTADGGALWIKTVGQSADSGRDVLGCWMLVSDPSVPFLDETVTLEHYAGVCEEVAPDRWETTDGTGIALVEHGVLVLLTSADQESAEVIGGTRPATATELSQTAEHLRLISRDELREYLLNSPVDSDGQPAIGS